MDDDVVDDFSFVADVYWDVKFKHKWTPSPREIESLQKM